MAQLGFVGLGLMGSRVAKRLLDAGHTLCGRREGKERRACQQQQETVHSDDPFNSVDDTEVAAEATVMFMGSLATPAPPAIAGSGRTRRCPDRTQRKPAVRRTR